MFFAMFLSFTSMSNTYFLGLYSITQMQVGNMFVNGIVMAAIEIFGSFFSGVIGPRVNAIKATRFSIFSVAVMLILRLLFSQIDFIQQLSVFSVVFIVIIWCNLHFVCVSMLIPAKFAYLTIEICQCINGIVILGPPLIARMDMPIPILAQLFFACFGTGLYTIIIRLHKKQQKIEQDKIKNLISI